MLRFSAAELEELKNYFQPKIMITDSLPKVEGFEEFAKVIVKFSSGFKEYTLVNKTWLKTGGNI